MAENKLKVSILILSLNEIEGMRVVLPRLKKEWLYERVVIDGGSTDGSIEYARSLDFTVVSQKGKGILAGLKEGFDATTGDAVILYTPDNNMIPEKIPEMIAKMEEGYETVCCSRYLDDAESEDDHIVSAFGNWMFTALLNFLFRTKFTDVLGGYRIFKRSLIEELDIEFSLAFPIPLNTRCTRRKLKIAEISGSEPMRIGGQSSRSIIINGVICLHRIISDFLFYRATP
jgi:glycosyltransferase involved in cell wall biosynthesis|tara:strand:+ start:75 stop:764 length:690 start_codon:yes stop_codon:yes gene_type:complete